MQPFEIVQYLVVVLPILLFAAVILWLRRR